MERLENLVQRDLQETQDHLDLKGLWDLKETKGTSASLQKCHETSSVLQM